jgi:uncharacterized protein DUF3768
MSETPDHFLESDAEIDPQTEANRTLNDQLRRTFAGGRVVITQGIQALGDQATYRVLQAVREFADFTADNDPYHTHDFGAFEVEGQRCMFKIDAYDQNLEYGSPDPADPSVTTRVLTIFLASEY